MDHPLSITSNVSYRRELLDMVMSSATEGIVIVNHDKRILYSNPAVERITGYSNEELIGEGQGFLRHELDKTACTEICEIAHEKDHFRQEITVHKKHGEEISILLSLDTLRNPDGKIEYFLGLLTDMTEIKKSREEIEFLATHDVLTSLPNRNLMEARLEQAVARAVRLKHMGALLFLDLDFFKDINDTHGHSLGDELLKHVALRLKDSCRKQDTVSRFGGDEFLMIMEDIQKIADVENRTRSLINALQQPFKIGDYTLNISASIGIALFPGDAINVKALIHAADIAMYKAKKSGRNAFHIDTGNTNTDTARSGQN